MTKEISREVRRELGAVVVTLETDEGQRSVHTIYVLNTDTCPTCGRKNHVVNESVDVDATIEKLKSDIDAAATAWNDKTKKK